MNTQIRITCEVIRKFRRTNGRGVFSWNRSNRALTLPKMAPALGNAPS